MSDITWFTPEEEKEFGDWEFQRRRESELDFLKHGVALSCRHQEWIRGREIQREQQAIRPAVDGCVQNISPVLQPYGNEGSKLSYARQYQDRSTSPGPSGGVWRTPVHLDLVDSEPPFLDHVGFNSESHVGYGQEADQSDDGGTRTSMAKAMAKLGNNLRDVRMHSGRKGWKGLVATLDTGAKGNWIRKKTVERLSLIIEDGLPIECTTIDGRKFTSSETVEATWGVQGQSKTCDNVFHVAPNDAPFDVLFGRKILSSGEVDFESQESPVLVTVEKNKIDKAEQKDIEMTQAELDTQRDQFAPKKQPVKWEKANKSTTKSSSTNGPRQGHDQQSMRESRKEDHRQGNPNSSGCSCLLT